MDIWTALVLIARYGEFPSIKNVPNNKDGCFQRTSWNLPEGFVKNLFETCGFDYPGEESQYSEEFSDSDTESDLWGDCDAYGGDLCEDYNERKRVLSFTDKCEFLPESQEMVVEWVLSLNSAKKAQLSQTKISQVPKKRALDILVEINWGDDTEDYIYQK